MGAMMYFGTVTTPSLNLHAQTSIHQDNRVEIVPEDLPLKVKEAILDDEELKTMPITKAFKVTDMDGSVTYEAHFGMEEETIVKKYDEEGEEIEDV
ncbi:hypothetical protein GCM10011339_05700 [Echinicola rosea]|uniref:PepSY domain-containing protein n=2 Tax=Echinicola rosea TaxID=1807691 RepID=A0ABQ1UJY6_9BACT|nr:hypothetical protein GCM10011339_05700 [Echinicola rosea]